MGVIKDAQFENVSECSVCVNKDAELEIDTFKHVQHWIPIEHVIPIATPGASLKMLSQ